VSKEILKADQLINHPHPPFGHLLLLPGESLRDKDSFGAMEKDKLTMVVKTNKRPGTSSAWRG